MMRRTRSLKISAPPPGRESMPASRSRSSTSRDRRFCRAGRSTPTSTMVKAFRWTCGKRCFEAAQHLAIPIEGQFRVQAADDVELGDRFAPAFAGAMPDFLKRHGVGFGIFGALAEGAKAATGHADVGGIDVAVDVEVGDRCRVCVRARDWPYSRPTGCRRSDRALRRLRTTGAGPLPLFQELASGGGRQLRFRIDTSAAQNTKNNMLT